MINLDSLKSIAQIVIKNSGRIFSEMSKIEIAGTPIHYHVARYAKDYIKNINKSATGNSESEYVKMDDILKERMVYFKNLSIDALREIDDDLPEIISTYKVYINSENDDNLEELASLLMATLKDKPILVAANDTLSSKIGEENYLNLFSIVIVHSIKVSKLFYQFSTDVIDQIDLKDKLKSLYNNYVIQVIDFVKSNEKLLSFAPEIIDFAFGNKARSIFNFAMKITKSILFKNKETIKEVLYEENNINSEIITEGTVVKNEKNLSSN